MRLVVALIIALLGVIAVTVPVPPETEFCPMGMPMTAMAMSAMQTQDPPQEEPPEGNPTHTEPTDFCRPVSRDGKMPCMCLKQDPDGCKAGKRETEHRICQSWCWKQYCKCCSS